MMINRMEQRSQMLVDRLGKCDVCALKATDMHEIASRHMTLSNPLARNASFDKRICSILCRSCHNIAHNATFRSILLAINVGYYGLSEVNDALNRINSFLRFPLPISLPDFSLVVYPKNNVYFRLFSGKLVVVRDKALVIRSTKNDQEET